MLLPDRELVVVHPHLEHVALDADLGAEALHRVLVLLLDAPPDAARERAHLLLLLRRELGAEALLHRHERTTASSSSSSSSLELIRVGAGPRGGGPASVCTGGGVGAGAQIVVVVVECHDHVVRGRAEQCR